MEPRPNNLILLENEQEKLFKGKMKTSKKGMRRMASDPDPGTDVEHIGDTHVAHEGAVVETIDEQMRRTSAHASIATVTATEIPDAGVPGAVYAEAEVVALRTQLVAVNARLAEVVAALNSVLEVLRDAELVPMPAPPG